MPLADGMLAGASEGAAAGAFCGSSSRGGMGCEGFWLSEAAGVRPTTVSDSSDHPRTLRTRTARL